MIRWLKWLIHGGGTGRVLGVRTVHMTGWPADELDPRPHGPGSRGALDPIRDARPAGSPVT